MVERDRTASKGDYHKLNQFSQVIVRLFDSAVLVWFIRYPNAMSINLKYYFKKYNIRFQDEFQLFQNHSLLIVESFTVGRTFYIMMALSENDR